MKKILITGASTGIGAEISRNLASGNHLFLHYNQSTDAMMKVKDEVQALGATVTLIQADITKEDACKAMIDAVLAETDTLDVVINNAGGLVQRQPVDGLQWDLMERIFALNVFSLMKITSLSIPLLRKSTQDPCIVNVSSIVVRHGGPGATLYGAAKGAVDTFTRGCAKELAPLIRVNSVVPGVIDTPFHHKVSTSEQMANWAANNPLGRNGKPQHIASAVRLLIDNDFIDGEAIDVNGGLTIR